MAVRTNGLIYTYSKKFREESDTNTFNKYIEMLWSKYTSDIGVFGVDAAYYHLKMLCDVLPLETLLGRGISLFYLTRHNIVAQGISLFIAQQTGTTHCLDEYAEERPKADTVQ